MAKIPVTQQERATHTKEVLQALMRFRRIVGSAKHHFRSVQAECGISGAELWALWQVSVEPGLRVGQLARRLSIHQSTASNLLKQLQAKGLIVHTRKGLDQRVVSVFLTDTGEEVLKKAPEPVRGVLAEAVDRLSGKALRQLNKALQSLLLRIHARGENTSKRPLSNLLG